MFWIGLDSSDKNLTLALFKDGRLVSFREQECWQRQSELATYQLDSLLKDNNVEIAEIGKVLSSVGPGSYTGVRISLTIAKTIAMALGVPLYTCSSLELLRDARKTSICLMNARGKRSYCGIYSSDGSCLEKDNILTNEEVKELVSSHPDYAVCGDLSYLGLPSSNPNRPQNMAFCFDQKHLIEEKMSAKPVYLKDDYESGTFKTVIRRTLPSDLDAIMAIENNAFKHPYSLQDMLYELHENPLGYFYTAVVGVEVVGFINFMITFSSATINQIAVREDFRSKGIGNLLLGQLLKDCRSQADHVDYLTLEVRQSNTKAQKFYKKHGFEEIEIKRGYYDDGEDAVYMVRSLAND